MTLLEVRDVFKGVLPKATFHYFATSKPLKYIVWAEDGQSSALYADDKIQEQAIEGTVDLFTKTEYDPLFNAIQKAMNNADMTIKGYNVQHEEDTGYIHHEWVWEVTNSFG